MSIKEFFLRLGSVISLTAIYMWWSRLYRIIWEFKYRDVPVKAYRTIEELAGVMENCLYVSDGPKQLGDAISYPGTVQHLIDINAGIGDCDEFAIYIANALEKSSTYGGFENGRFTLAPYKGLVVDTAKLLTLGWLEKDYNTYEGHNVCLISWTDGTYSYMDYGLPSTPCKDLSCVLAEILAEYAPGGKLLSWSIHDQNLNFQEVHW